MILQEKIRSILQEKTNEQIYEIVNQTIDKFKEFYEEGQLPIFELEGENIALISADLVEEKIELLYYKVINNTFDRRSRKFRQSFEKTDEEMYSILLHLFTSLVERANHLAKRRI